MYKYCEKILSASDLDWDVLISHTTQEIESDGVFFAAPDLGEHTEEILKSLGFDSKFISELADTD